MKRVAVLACAVPVLFAVPAAAAAVPPPGDEFHTAAQLSAVLLTGDEIPAGYTAGGTSSGTTVEFGLYGSDLCDGGEPDQLGAVTSAEQDFGNAQGGRLVVRVTAIGTAKAQEVVDLVSAAPAQCPVVTRDGVTTRYTALPEPAGLTAVTEGAGPTETLRVIALASGDVSVIIEETGAAPDPAGFLAVAAAVRAKLPIPEADLEKGLLTRDRLNAEWPGFHDATGDNQDYFTEYDCSGALVRFAPEGTEIKHRAFEQSDGDPTVHLAVASLGADRAEELVAAIRKRISDCPDAVAGTRTRADTTPPETDLTTVGVYYLGDPNVIRTVIVHRGLCAEVVVRTGDVVPAAMVDRFISATISGILTIEP